MKLRSWKNRLIGGAILLALPLLACLAVYFGSDERERKFLPPYADASTPVKLTVPLSVTDARARLVRKLGVTFTPENTYDELSHPEYGPPFQTFMVLPNDSGGLDMQFRATDTGFSSDAPISMKNVRLDTEDPGLPAYMNLPIPQRKYDLQIHGRKEWTAADVRKNGKPLPYRSLYFLHFTSVAPGRTEILILGYQACVIDGKRWSVLGDMFVTLPRRVDNLRPVPPSPADKRSLRDSLMKILSSP